MAKKKLDVVEEQLVTTTKIGLDGPIGEQEIIKANKTLEEYSRGKKILENKILENENWWKLKQWENAPNEKDKETPASAWVFNSLANKHADIMDNFPEPVFLPQSEDDKDLARTLSDIMPCILRNANFEQEYSDGSWYKLKQGAAAYIVDWDNSKLNGLGDVAIKHIDLLNLFWETGIKDIQDSRNFFNIEFVDKDLLLEKYDHLENTLSDSQLKIPKYTGIDSQELDAEKAMVVDWYYKDNINGRTVVHYVKYVNNQLIYASENDPTYAEVGYYNHGLYPIVIDNLFPIENSPVGFGYIDIMRQPQLYIDRLDKHLLDNAAIHSKPRWFTRRGLIDLDKAADLDQVFIEVDASVLDENNMRQFKPSPIPSFVENQIVRKVEELKETSGNRDFSQGGTTSGVTAASAIAALQEAGSKLSRDMIKTSYRGARSINYLSFELVRQFYTEERTFRITGPDNKFNFVKFDNRNIAEQSFTGPDNSIQYKKPEFDINIQAQRKSPFVKAAQNETAKELFGMGIFNPQLAEQALIMLDMMDFEGIDDIKQKIQAQAQMIQKFQMLGQIAMEMAGLIDSSTGTNQYGMQVSQLLGIQAPMPQGDVRTQPVNDRGLPKTDNTQATKARLKASKVATPM